MVVATPSWRQILLIIVGVYFTLVVEWHLGYLRFAACWHPLRDSWVWVEVGLGRSQPSVGDSLSKDDSVKCKGRNKYQLLRHYNMYFPVFAGLFYSYTYNNCLTYPWRLPLCIFAHYHRIIILQQGVRRRNHAYNVKINRNVSNSAFWYKAWEDFKFPR